MAESPAASRFHLQEMESLSNTVCEPSSLSFPTEFPYEFDSFGSNSDLNSPVESVGSSTETDSIDEEDLYAGLTQQLAWSSLYETQKSSVEKMSVKASSPQSTLAGIDGWYRPNSRSQLQSPLTMFLTAENDLIYEAAEEAVRLKLRKDNPLNTGFMSARSSIPVEFTSNGDYTLFSNQGCPRNPAFAAQVQRARQEMVLQAICASSWARQTKVNWSAQPPQKQEIQNRGRNIAHGVSHISLCQSAWLPPPTPPPQHQNRQPQHGSAAIRSVHLGESAVKRAASSGTGVFLPRRYVNPSECRQKSGSPAVRYQEEMKSPIQSTFNTCLAPGFDGIFARRKPLLPLQRNYRPESAITHELHLPQEWTY